MADLSAAIADEALLAGDEQHRRSRPDPGAPAGGGRGRPTAFWSWGALGLVGSVLVALAGSGLATAGESSWWFSALPIFFTPASTTATTSAKAQCSGDARLTA